jgi:hypothetical protein
MKMYRTDPDGNFDKWRDWHVITIAKASGAALEIYAWGVHHLDLDTIRQFADQVNEKCEALTLYPKAPISALPFRYFKFMDEYDFPQYLDEFRLHLQQVIELNRTQIHARKILVDFHRDSDPVWDCYLYSAEKFFKEFLAEDEVDEIALMK